MKDKKTGLFSLFFSFFKIGLFTFGGGMAMLPMLEKECVDKHSWASKEELLDIYAIGQCTPGIIAINTATYIGLQKRGILGSVFSTLGMVTPSFVIIILLSTVLRHFSDNIYVIKAFHGIRVAVCALILGSLLKLSKSAIVNSEKLIIALCALALQIVLGLSPVWIVIMVIIYSLIVFFTDKKRVAK